MIAKSQIRGQSETAVEDWLATLHINREDHPHLYVHVVAHAMQVVLNNLDGEKNIGRLRETCEYASAHCKSVRINSESAKKFADLFERKHIARDKSEADISFTGNDHRKYTMNMSEYEKIIMNEAYCIACEAALKALGEERPARMQGSGPRK